MSYRWRPSKSQAREYAERMKQREELLIIKTIYPIRKGCTVSFHSKYHNRIIKGIVTNSSYGSGHFIGQNNFTGEQLYSKGQHTFTIEENGIKYKVKGRNLYDSLLEHTPGEESFKEIK